MGMIAVPYMDSSDPKKEKTIRAIMEKWGDEKLIENASDISFRTLLGNLKLSDRIVLMYQDEIGWGKISRCHKITKKFFCKFEDMLDFKELTHNEHALKKILNEDIIRKHKNDVDWEHLSFNYWFTEDFLEEFANRVDWYSYCFHNNRKMSDSFIRKFSLHISWRGISYHNSLSEDIIREFSDKIDWQMLSTWNQFSETLIEEFVDRIDWKGLAINSAFGHSILPESTRKKYRDRLHETLFGRW